MRSRLWTVVGVVFLALGMVWACATDTAAAETTCKVTVQAGDCDRTNTPVVVLIDAPADARSAVLRDAEGHEIVGQLTAPGLLHQEAQGKRELHFVVPSLGRGRSLRLTAALSTEAPAQGFAWKDTPGKFCELSYADRPVMRYMYEALDEQNREATYKVYHHLYNPAGTRFVTKGPGGLYTHHRGIFYGFNRITYPGGKCDTWHCKPGAYLSHEGFLASEAGPVLGRHLVAVDWHGQKGEVFAHEQRELTVYHVPGGILVEFASRLKTAGGKVILDGDPQHAGFQFRAAQEVAAGDQKQTYYLRVDGKGGPGETRNWGPGKDECANLPWNAMSFVIDGRRYTAVYLDHPKNPKEARYSERSYGRFGSYFVYEMDEGNDLVVNYRLWLQDGEMTGEQCQALRCDFVDPPAVQVSP